MQPVTLKNIIECKFNLLSLVGTYIYQDKLPWKEGTFWSLWPLLSQVLCSCLRVEEHLVYGLEPFMNWVAAVLKGRCPILVEDQVFRATWNCYAMKFKMKISWVSRWLSWLSVRLLVLAQVMILWVMGLTPCQALHSAGSLFADSLPLPPHPPRTLLHVQTLSQNINK